MAQTGEEIRQNGSETLRRLARALCKQVRVLRLVFPSWRLDELVPAIENQMDTFANLGYDPEKFPHRTKRRYAMFMLKLSRLGIDASPTQGVQRVDLPPCIRNGEETERRTAGLWDQGLTRTGRSASSSSPMTLVVAMGRTRWRHWKSPPR